MHAAREAGKHIIFNPAPALLIPDFAYQDIDTLVMNESEARLLGQDPRDPHSSETSDLSPLLTKFLRLGVQNASIITLGERGVIYATASGKQGTVPARKVKVVDTTAAGDTFLGAYAAKRAEHVGEGFDYDAALAFATLAASKCVERKGAMSAIPHLKELQQ
jgi:ribokinase